MPEREGTIGNVDVRELPTASLSNLATRAREAYGQRRTKDCLDLTRAILLIDPENPEAQLMRSAIRAEMHQDLENSQALLRSAQMKDSPGNGSQADNPVNVFFRPHGVAAEIITNPSEANPSSPVLVSSPVPVEEAPAPASPTIVSAPIRAKKRRWLKRASVIVFLGLAAAGLSQGLRIKSSSALVQVPTTQVSGGPAPITNEVPQALPATVPSPLQPAPKVNRSPAAADNAITPDTPVPPPSPKLSEGPRTLTASGTLAISSPTSVDIYMDDLYVGSAPVSLEISAGSHTLEYRHGNLRKRVTHVINSSETTRAMITFDVTLQVNAKPWAEVFLDGIDRKPLGQTPLSGVRVPIGTVLVFENPGFEPKKYRVTGSEAGIQIVFP
jgi:hypothetical protein